MKYFKKIEGKRIYLTPINPDDKETYVKWMNDRSVTDGTHATKRLTNLVGEEKWIQKVLEKGEYTFGIILKNKDRIIIITDDLSYGPRSDWESKANTSYAKKKIRDYWKKTN